MTRHGKLAGVLVKLLNDPHLHLRDIGVRWVGTAVALGSLGLGLAQVLAGGVIGSVGHCDGGCRKCQWREWKVGIRQVLSRSIKMVEFDLSKSIATPSYRAFYHGCDVCL